MDAYWFGTVAFASFVLLAPFGGPYNTNDWSKKLRDQKVNREWMIFGVQFLWMLERLLSGLGFWFFLLTDWNVVNSFIAIAALIVGYMFLDYFVWPAIYFYPTKQTNYWIVAGAYVLGHAALLTAWILMLVYQNFTVLLWAFWTSFALLAGSTFIGIVLGIVLWYASGQMKISYSPVGGQAPSSILPSVRR